MERRTTAATTTGRSPARPVEQARRRRSRCVRPDRRRRSGRSSSAAGGPARSPSSPIPAACSRNAAARHEGLAFAAWIVRRSPSENIGLPRLPAAPKSSWPSPARATLFTVAGGISTRAWNGHHSRSAVAQHDRDAGDLPSAGLLVNPPGPQGQHLCTAAALALT